MSENLKYTALEEKYTSDEFMEIYKERENKLFQEYKTLTVEEARKRFSHLFDDCPIGLHIDPFCLMRVLSEYFPDWYNNSNRRVYKINVGNISENEVESYVERIKKRLKNESL